MLQWWADFVDRQSDPHPLPAQNGQLTLAEVHDRDIAEAASSDLRNDNLVIFPG
jgi:hypothetical protein